jgi:hypothetical protein
MAGPSLNDERIGSPEWIKKFRGGNEPVLPGGGAGIAAQGVSLVQSLAKTHLESWSQEKLVTFIDQYIEYAKSHPNLKTQYDEAVSSRDRLIQDFVDTQQRKEYDKVALEAGKVIAADKANLLKVQTPAPLLARAAVGEVAIPIAEAADDLVKFVPYVGPAVMLIEAASGRDIVGLFGGERNLDDETRALDAILVALPYAGRLVRAGREATTAIAEISQNFGVSPERVVSTLGKLSALQGESQALGEASARLKLGFPLSSEQTTAVARVEKILGSQNVRAGNDGIARNAYTVRGNPEKMLMENQRARKSLKNG